MLLEYSAAIDGTRVDYVRAPAYVYLDTGSERMALEGTSAHGCAIVKRTSATPMQIIPVGEFRRLRLRPRDLCPDLPTAKLRLRAFDVRGALLSTGQMAPSREGAVDVAPVRGAFHYIVDAPETL